MIPGQLPRLGNPAGLERLAQAGIRTLLVDHKSLGEDELDGLV